MRAQTQVAVVGVPDRLVAVHFTPDSNPANTWSLMTSILKYINPAFYWRCRSYYGSFHICSSAF
jgi:hypothetical protein